MRYHVLSGKRKFGVFIEYYQRFLLKKREACMKNNHSVVTYAKLFCVLYSFSY